MMRVAFITNLCPHYRVRTFETLAQQVDAEYYFFSAGDDWYWMQEHSASPGRFRYRHLPGVRIGGTRITPTLPWLLARGGYDVFIKCINGRFALPITFLTARLTGRPFILWTGVWMRLDTAAHRLFHPVTRYLYRNADAVVVYGDHVARFLEREGVAKERIFVAPHAVDNDAYNRAVGPDELAAVRKSLGIGPGVDVVLYIGRLVAGKGLDVLLRAFASLERADAVLVIAGSGSARAALEHLAKYLGIAERVRFPGYVDAAATVAYYALASAYVLPSVTTARFKEPWGLVVNEAFNQGLPVIATDAVGAAAGGLVKDGVNGFVVPEGDAPALTRALTRLLRDRALRDRLGRGAVETIREWTNDRMVGGFRDALLYVLRR